MKPSVTNNTTYIIPHSNDINQFYIRMYHSLGFFFSLSLGNDLECSPRMRKVGCLNPGRNINKYLDNVVAVPLPTARQQVLMSQLIISLQLWGDIYCRPYIYCRRRQFMPVLLSTHIVSLKHLYCICLYRYFFPG